MEANILNMKLLGLPLNLFFTWIMGRKWWDGSITVDKWKWIWHIKFCQTKREREKMHSFVRYIAEIPVEGKKIKWIISIHQKYMCTMVTLFPTQRMRLLAMPEFFGTISDLLCSFWAVVGLNILLKAGSLLFLYLTHWENDIKHSWTSKTTQIELLDCMLDDCL